MGDEENKLTEIQTRLTKHPYTAYPLQEAEEKPVLEWMQVRLLKSQYVKHHKTSSQELSHTVLKSDNTCMSTKCAKKDMLGIVF